MALDPLGKSMMRARLINNQTIVSAARGSGVEPDVLNAMEQGKMRVTDKVIAYYEHAFRLDSKEAKRLRDSSDHC